MKSWQTRSFGGLYIITLLWYHRVYHPLTQVQPVPIPRMIPPARIFLTAVCLLSIFAGVREACAGGDQPHSTPKAPVPSAEVQARIVKKLEEIFDFAAAKTPEAQLALAGELHKLSKEAAGNPDEQFVLLRKVMELANTAGDAELMVRAVGEIGSRFDISAADVETRMLLSFARNATTEKRIQSLLDAARPAFEKAMAEHRYDVAHRIVNAQYAACQRPAGQKFRKAISETRDEVRQLYEKYQKFRQALAAIESDPTNAEASLVLGRWYCFVEDDWKRGPSYLAEGTDAELKTLAKHELQKPPEPADQVKLGDRWWDLAKKRKDDDEAPMMRRAGYWYRKAQPTVSGLAKLKIEKRLPKIAELERPKGIGKPSEEPAPQYVPPKSVAAMFGLQPSHWKIEGDGLHGRVGAIDSPSRILTKPFQATSLQFGFRIKAKWYHCIRIEIDGRSYLFSRGHWYNTGTFFVIDGQKVRHRDGPKVTSPEEWHALGATLRDNILTFYYDGQQQWQGPVPANPAGKHTIRVGFASHETTIGLKDVLLQPR